jgi:hypothetical protein
MEVLADLLKAHFNTVGVKLFIVCEIGFLTSLSARG